MKTTLKLLGLILLLNSCSTIESEQYPSNLDTVAYSFTVLYDTSYFDYYQDFPRDITPSSNATQQQATLDFYEMFLEDTNDKDMIDQIKDSIQSITTIPAEQIQLAVTLVQKSIAYDHKKLDRVGNWDVYYPMETLIWKKGVCSDQSLLLAKILVYLDYKICFFIFPENNHMALGIKTNTPGFAGSGYEYIETTGSFDIGEVPTGAPGQTLNLLSEEPWVAVPKYNGSLTFNGFEELQNDYQRLNDRYGNGYTTASIEGKMCRISLKQMADDLIALKKDIDDMTLSIQNGNQELIDSYNDSIDSYNDRVREYNNLQEECSSL